MPKAIQINAKDNVAVVPQSVEAGQQVQVVETGAVVTATEFVKAGHKICTARLSHGGYGCEIRDSHWRYESRLPEGWLDSLPQCRRYNGRTMCQLLPGVS